MTLIELMVVLGAFMVCLCLGAVWYARHLDAKHLAAMLNLDAAVKREKDRAKSKDHTTAGERETW